MSTIVRTVAVKATVAQTHSLGQWFFEQGHSPEATLEWLKSKSYTVRGVRFNGAYVANYVAGARYASATAVPVVAPKPKPKAKRVTKAKSAPVADVADNDEIPF